MRCDFSLAVAIFAAIHKVIKMKLGGSSSITLGVHRFSVSVTIWKTDPAHPLYLRLSTLLKMDLRMTIMGNVSSRLLTLRINIHH